MHTALKPLALAATLLFSLAPAPAPAQVLGAQNACDWKSDLTTTGAPLQPRAYAGAVALANGDVLLTGGSDLRNAMASAELFSPRTGVFTPLQAPLTSPRYVHTVTRLMDNTVLLTGGSWGGWNGGALASAELFDGNAFVAVGSMARERMGHSANLLQSGEVLIVGGLDQAGRPVAEIELYAPWSRSFRVVGMLSEPRGLHSATQRVLGYIKDEVIVAGGQGKSGALASIERIDFDASQGTISVSTIGQLNQPRQEHSATRLLSGEILVAGGGDGRGSQLDSLERISTSGHAWPDGKLQFARQLHGATLLPTGQVLFSGGYARGRAMAEVEIYDDAGTGITTRLLGMLQEPRFAASAVELPLGQALLVGGFTGLGISMAAGSELYDPFWGGVGLMEAERRNHSASPIPGGRVLLAGGDPGYGAAQGSAELFNPYTGTTDRVVSMVTARTHHEAVRLANGHWLLSGGTGIVGGGSLREAELYDPVNLRFVATGPMEVARQGHQASLLPSGEVMVSGGTAAMVHRSVEQFRFDPLTGSGRFVPGPAMPDDLTGHAQSALAGGALLISGGYSQSAGGHLRRVQLFDPITRNYAAQADMATARSQHRAVPLGASVLVSGGLTWGNRPTASLELLPGGAQGWLKKPRYHHSASSVPAAQATVWVVGGTDQFNGSPIPDAEAIDPTSLISTPLPGLGVGRSLHQATPLRDGRLMLSGGRVGATGSSRTVLISKTANCKAPPPNVISKDWVWPWATTWPFKPVKPPKG